jgi:hypothetical protein
MRQIKLECSHCGNTVSYDADVDPDLPEEVARIVTNECDKCEAANGGFGDERWFDKDGNEVVPS